MPDFKKLQDIELDKRINSERIEKIAGRRGLKPSDVHEVKKFDDVLAIGKPDLSYPALVIINGPKKMTVFRVADLGPQVRGKLINTTEEVAVFHYGDKRYVRPLTENYDQIDALDDLSIGIQRHRWRAEDLVMAGYNRDSFVLNKDGVVTGNYKDLHAESIRESQTETHTRAKEKVESVIKENVR